MTNKVFDGFHNFLTNSKNQFTAVTAVFTAAAAENIDETAVTNTAATSV